MLGRLKLIVSIKRSHTVTVHRDLNVFCFSTFSIVAPLPIVQVVNRDHIRLYSLVVTFTLWKFKSVGYFSIGHACLRRTYDTTMGDVKFR